jgi:hypothetical protein
VQAALTKATEAGLPIRLISRYKQVTSEDKVIDFLRGRFAHIDERFDRMELKLRRTRHPHQRC